MRAVLVAILATVVVAPSAARAERMPDPVKPVPLSQYTGRWYEVARYPNGAERGCVAVTSDYSQPKPNLVSVLQTCRKKTTDGRRWAVRGTGPLLNQPHNSKFRLTYYLVVSREYWVMEQSDDGQWAIVGDPNADYVWLFHRQPVPAPEQMAVMVEAAKRLGYKTERFEYPPQPPR